MMIVVRERLWLTADRARLVKHGDPAAAFLYCIPGHAVSEKDARRFGLSEDGRLKPASNESTMKTPEIKEAQPGEAKQRLPEETKEILPGETKRKRSKKRDRDSAGNVCA